MHLFHPIFICALAITVLCCPVAGRAQSASADIPPTAAPKTEALFIAPPSSAIVVTPVVSETAKPPAPATVIVGKNPAPSPSVTATPAVVTGAAPATLAAKKPLVIKVNPNDFKVAEPNVASAPATPVSVVTQSAAPVQPVATQLLPPVAAKPLVAATPAVPSAPTAAVATKTAPLFVTQATSAPDAVIKPVASVVPPAAPVTASAIPAVAPKTAPLFTQAAPAPTPLVVKPAAAVVAQTVPAVNTAPLVASSVTTTTTAFAAPAVGRPAPLLIQENPPPSPAPAVTPSTTSTTDQSNTNPGGSTNIAAPATTQLFKGGNPTNSANKAETIEAQEATVNFDEKQAIAFLKNIAGSNKILLNLDSYTADIMDPVHIDEAVAFALKNNFEVLASQQKSRGAYWDKIGGFSEYGPSIELDADAGHERSQPAAAEDEFGNRILDNTHNRQDHDIIVRQPLIDPSLITDILSAKDKESVAKDDQLDTREGVAFDTVSTYLSLLESRLTIQLADNYKNYLDALEKRMKVRVQGGAATEADLQRIRSRATAAEAVRIEALGTYTTHMTELRRLMRMTPKILVVPTVLAPKVPEDAQDALQQALRSNPSYLSTLKKIDLAKDDRDKSLSTFSPKLSFEYSNTYSFNADGAAEGSPLNGAYPTQKDQQIMLVAQFALNGATAAAGSMSGEAKVDEMHYRAEDARTRIEEGIVSSYTAINAAKQRSNALAKNVDANQKVMAGFETQFNNGTRSLFDLLDAYEQFYNSQLNLLRVTIAGAKASYQVRRMMGQLAASIVAAEK